MAHHVVSHEVAHGVAPGLKHALPHGLHRGYTYDPPWPVYGLSRMSLLTPRVSAWHTP